MYFSSDEFCNYAIYVGCGTPRFNMSNSHTNQKVTTFESFATYTCDIGYDLQGNDTIVCEDTGHWTLPNLTCIIKGLKTTTYIYVC